MLMSTSGAAVLLNNLLIITTISDWFLSGICPHSTASLLIVFDLSPADDLDFLSSGTTLTPDFSASDLYASIFVALFPHTH